MSQRTLCLLRPWQSGDEEGLQGQADNRKIWRNLRDSYPQPYTNEDAWNWVSRNMYPPYDQRELAIVVDGAVAGGMSFHPREEEFRYCLEFGYWLGEDYWGRGIMTEAVRLGVAYAFNTFDIHRIQAWAYAWNPASRRVLEKAGFTLEGCARKEVFKDGAFVDRWLFGLLREEWQGHD
jgi:RimJ/RimL family protein N-acetyltransferase